MPDHENSTFDADLSAPPDGVPVHSPVTTKLQVLPFGELSWENFERLCYRLAGRAERVEYVARYGRSGQSQQGIDLFARMVSGKYEVWQAKRYGSISPGDVKAIVGKFRAGTWKHKSERLILAVQAPLTDTKVQNEIEEQAKSLWAEGITFVPRGGPELSEMLRSRPELVDDFFGRQWAEAFLGPEVSKALGARLDGAEFAEAGYQLRRFYDASFHLLDVGAALPLTTGRATEDAPPSLLRRFAVPDVIVRDTIADEQLGQKRDKSKTRSDTLGTSGIVGETLFTKTKRRDYLRRTPLTSWLADGMHLAAIGDAGSGKSTLLRCIALDLLTERGVFPQIARRWGGLLPIHVSFSRWSRVSATLGRAAGLKEIVAETLQPALTADLSSLLNRAIDERRVLLLLDGLDEWSEEQAARTTLQHIFAFVATHNVPTIVTARPRGLDKIGAIPPGWRIAELAPLSPDQQRTLAEVWFSRVLAHASASTQSLEIKGPIEARLDRFFVELARDRRLLSLAGNPLLLVGLVALSIRQIALPRNRMQAIQSLVAILVETHPEHRATAAGDTKARFVHIPDAEDRRAALGRLAFVARSASGGGTYDIKMARRSIRDYLVDSTTFAYSVERAQNAANEMLAVNAETEGLLAERAPGEIGFAHAVFEEYLAAEHIHRWALPEIMEFVRVRSGDPLWRNVISNLVSLLARPTEVESVVAAIETARAAEASLEGAISRDVLLADIAFNSSRKQPATTQRLVGRAFDVIERGDWMLARREVLKAALTNVGEAIALTPVDSRLASWTPRRGHLSQLFEILSGWKPAPDLLAVLLKGIHDEERGNQRSAARALSRLYSGDQTVQQRLRATLRSTLDLSVAAAALEALTLGWPRTPDLADLHAAAFSSSDATLRLVGISGRLAAGCADQSDRDGIVALLSDLSEIDFWDRREARSTLSQHWPDDPTIINTALKALGWGATRRNQFERESAMHYLIRCSPTNPAIADWVRRELKQRYPFSLAHDDLWDYVAPFAVQHPDIKATVIDYVRSDTGRHHLNDFQSLIIKLGGSELRDELIKVARVEDHWGVFWAVRPLLSGWDRSDPIVASFMDEIVLWDDKKLQNLAAMLPQILTDFDACRARLLSFTRSARPRLDLIARGLASLGCGAKDTEVVDTLLAGAGNVPPLFDPGGTLITHFSTNSRVRQHALKMLNDRVPPLEALAQVYEDDAGIRPQILAVANPLPVTLRGDIAEAASTEANSRYDFEVDGELKIGGSIYYHRYVARTSSPSVDHLKKLVDVLHAVGPDLRERRAAAFAGLLLLGRLNDIRSMKEHGDKPLNIQSGAGHRRESEALMALMCERWQEIHQAFGAELPSRFGDFGADEGHMWDCLAPHINGSPAARRAFLSFCDLTDAPLRLNSFIALAREQPSSEQLLDHCWRAFDQGAAGQHTRLSPWEVQRIRLEVAYILRDHFRQRVDVKERLRESLTGRQSAGIVALALVEPNDPLLNQLSHRPKDIGQLLSDWVTALHLASARSGAEEFVDVALAMINRRARDIWNFQEMTNRAVIERLQRDPETVRRLKETLAANPTESETASLPRYLMAAGELDDHVHERCRSLLQREARYSLPRSGYDAVDDSTRAVSLSLLEALSPSLSP